MSGIKKVVTVRFDCGFGHSHESRKGAEDCIAKQQFAPVSYALELTVRAENCLKSAGIMTVKQLVKRSEDELLKIPGLGRLTLDEIKEKLKERGLSLK